MCVLQRISHHLHRPTSHSHGSQRAGQEVWWGRPPLASGTRRAATAGRAVGPPWLTSRQHRVGMDHDLGISAHAGLRGPIGWPMPREPINRSVWHRALENVHFTYLDPPQLFLTLCRKYIELPLPSSLGWAHRRQYHENGRPEVLACSSLVLSQTPILCYLQP